MPPPLTNTMHPELSSKSILWYVLLVSILLSFKVACLFWYLFVSWLVLLLLLLFVFFVFLFVCLFLFVFVFCLFVFLVCLFVLLPFTYQCCFHLSSFCSCALEPQWLISDGKKKQINKVSHTIQLKQSCVAILQ